MNAEKNKIFEINPETDALILVDIQNDFCEGGSLAVPGGSEIIPGVLELSQKFEKIYATIDSHPANHSSFAVNHDGKSPFETIELAYGEQVLWPSHCVAGTHGEALHDSLVNGVLSKPAHPTVLMGEKIRSYALKGQNPEVDSYSAFFENDKVTKTTLDETLKKDGIKRVFLVGLAYDFCVGYSAIDAKTLGFESVVVKDLTRAINMPVNDLTTSDIIEEDFKKAGIEVTSASELYTANQIDIIENIEAHREAILSDFGVVATEDFDAEEACEVRIEYLKNFLINNRIGGYVLGISGGVDSSLAGRLAQIACERATAEGHTAKFTAVRLPSGVQFDEADAQKALGFINPHQEVTSNIGRAVISLNSEVVQHLPFTLSEEQEDYHRGNLKARLRMATQYYIAAATNSAVIGTDHNAEAVTGFFTKFGDGACDLIVLNGLNKRQVRLCAKHLGAPESVYSKPPTADLEDLNPGKLDDEGFGFPYDALDDFLEGKKGNVRTEMRIIENFLRTEHKRKPIVSFEKAPEFKHSHKMR